MIKVVQFGEGNFLRTFVDAYFDTLNKSGDGKYEVHIVKPIPFGNLDNFKKQNNKYHIVLRGVENGETVENVYKVDCVKSVIDPFANQDEFYSLATDEEVKLIVSNTTEAGICFNEKDKFTDTPPVSFPAKVTQLLKKRFEMGLDGFVFLPCELIDKNGETLKNVILQYAKLWDLGDDFIAWVQDKNIFCNTLVDRINTGYPKDEKIDLDYEMKMMQDFTYESVLNISDKIQQYFDVAEKRINDIDNYAKRIINEKYN